MTTNLCVFTYELISEEKKTGNRMKIASVVGARPQFIKAAIVTKKLKEAGISEVLVHTGQHYDFNMSDIFFAELEIPKPDYNLAVGSGLHGEQTGKMLAEIEKVLLRENPSLVLVYGDTNSTLAGALAASKLHIPVGHVEAGLRSFNKNMPEEINRVLTDHVADILFAPTDTAVENLKREGIMKGIYHVGDVMFDLALAIKDSVDEKRVLQEFGLNPGSFVLTTIHREENTDNQNNLLNIWEALKDLAVQGIKIFFPIHPRTEKALAGLNLLHGGLPHNLVISKPVSYTEMIVLESNAKVIITDSGGVQKEGYFFKTPCVIPRNETEWVEILNAGWNVLTGANRERLVGAVNNMWRDGVKNKEWTDFYGGGRASEEIALIVSRFR